VQSYRSNDKDTANIASSQMDVFSNSQSNGFNKSSIGEMYLAKYEAENGEIIIIMY
jgi:hypothetical protein